MNRVLSAKLSEELITDLGDAAEERGVTRNRFVRDALEAAVEGRVRWIEDEERTARLLRASLHRDCEALARLRR